MKFLLLSLLLLFNTIFLKSSDKTIVICFLVRNKAHILPYFLNLVESLNYNKKNLALWIRSDHNVDNSTKILDEWLTNVGNLYTNVDYSHDDSLDKHADQKSLFDWSTQRFQHILALKEKALSSARNRNFHYILYLDVGNFLIYPDVLNFLIKTEKEIVGPLLTHENYANFWGSVGEDGYYKRSKDYFSIVRAQIKGCFNVSLVYSAFLVDLTSEKTMHLTFNVSKLLSPFNKALDDFLIFMHSVQETHNEFYVCNSHNFGYIFPPQDSNSSLQESIKSFTEFRLDHVYTNGLVLQPSRFLKNSTSYETPSLISFDRIFVINLEKRRERREVMEAAMNILALNATFVTAVDGKNLNKEYLHANGIKRLPGYLDPFHQRSMKYGEIACFLSHYNIWRQMIKEKLKSILILEDDVRVASDFKERILQTLKDAERLEIEWDLIYFGRKRLVPPEEENFVYGSDLLVWPDYSHWSLAYALSSNGAKKLLKVAPLEKMLALDEFIPIMFDAHPNDAWKAFFPNRNLLAFSAYPLIAFPRYYIGNENYISDTEDSEVIHDEDKSSSPVKLHSSKEL